MIDETISKRDRVQQIELAIKRAPLTGTTQSCVTFQANDGARFYINNNKQALTVFKRRVMDEARITRGAVEPKPRGVGQLHSNKEDLRHNLVNAPKGYFSDGTTLVKGDVPKSIKNQAFNYSAYCRAVISMKVIDRLLNEKTKPVTVENYFSDDTVGFAGVSDKPINIPVNDHTFVVFTDGEFKYLVNQYKLNVIKNRFPKATYGVTSTRSIIAYVDNTAPVGVAAGIVEEDTAIKLKMYESFNNPSKRMMVKRKTQNVH